MRGAASYDWAGERALLGERHHRSLVSSKGERDFVVRLLPEEISRQSNAEIGIRCLQSQKSWP